MGHALYRKYRPLKLKDVAGQDHITSTLTNAIKKEKIAHAYLFTGPRGVGKTSVARILAHEINHVDYTSQSSHMDIIEIDAASNRGIEEIRDLREKVYIAPTTSKYKIYIIDEVHMLTTYAFNALLKTLEEPPEHVVFILATTDAHKLPDTIISRTQRYNFKSVSNQDLINQLKMIAKTERLSITDSAVELIAEHGMGSFRDAISMLDQLNGVHGTIDADDIHDLLGVPSNTLVKTLINTIDECNNLAEVSTILEDMYQKGYQPAGIADSTISLLRSEVIEKNDNVSNKLMLIKDLLDVASSFNPNRFLEITLLKYAQLGSVTEKNPKTITTPKNEEITKPIPTKKTETKKPVEASIKPDEIVYDSLLTENVFSNLLQNLKTKYNTLYSIIRMAEHEFIDDELVLTFKFAFHQKRVSEKSNQQIITDLLQKITGKKTKLTCLLGQVENQNITSDITPNKEEDKIKTVSNIFGGAELLES